jgi:hypothetical protein
LAKGRPEQLIEFRYSTGEKQVLDK